MKRVATAVVLIPVVIASVLYAPMWLFILLVGIVGCITLFEFLRIAEKYGAYPCHKPLTLLVSIGWVIAAAQVFFNSASADHEVTLQQLMLADKFFSFALAILVFSLALLPTILLSLTMLGKDLNKSLPTAAFSVFSLPYVVVPFLLLISFRGSSTGAFMIFLIFCAVWSGDIAAYYVGKNFGKRKLAPFISPNKTYEGSVASLVFSVACCLIYVAITNRYFADFATGIRHLGLYGQPKRLMTIPEVIAFAIFVNIAAQLGDLAESMIKRGAGVKDSGDILPGHGGMLDRVDALLFAMPTAVLLFFFRPLSIPGPY